MLQKKLIFTSNLPYYSRAKIKNGLFTHYSTSHAMHRLHLLFFHKSPYTISHFSHIGVIPTLASVAVHPRL